MYLFKKTLKDASGSVLGGDAGLPWWNKGFLCIRQAACIRTWIRHQEVQRAASAGAGAGRTSRCEWGGLQGPGDTKSTSSMWPSSPVCLPLPAFPVLLETHIGAKVGWNKTFWVAGCGSLCVPLPRVPHRLFDQRGFASLMPRLREFFWKVIVVILGGHVWMPKKQAGGWVI